jgi:phosphate butyryltransferase
MDTAEILREVVRRETGLRTAQSMSHIAINEVPSYHKLLVTTDGGMILSPTLEQKKDIIVNAAEALRAIGYSCPKVGVLAAAEKVNPKLQDSTDAAALREMNRNGEITGCVVEGPISLDLAVSPEAVKTKGYESPCAGDVDILIVPNITAGNILGKSMTEFAGGKMAGLIVGAKCPIVVTSRGSSAEEKYNSLILAVGIAIQ